MITERRNRTMEWPPEWDERCNGKAFRVCEFLMMRLGYTAAERTRRLGEVYLMTHHEAMDEIGRLNYALKFLRGETWVEGLGVEEAERNDG